MSRRSRSSIPSRSANCPGGSPFPSARVSPGTAVTPENGSNLSDGTHLVGADRRCPKSEAHRMKPVGFLLFATAMLCAGLRVTDAADPRYPDWPCVQAKVPDLSIAA